MHFKDQIMWNIKITSENVRIFENFRGGVQPNRMHVKKCPYCVGLMA
jgi:hypothetical protein